MSFRTKTSPETLTVKEAADRLGLGLNQAYEGLRHGQIPGYQIGTRWIIPRAAFEQWLATPNTQPRAA